jgi:hypothetical protein
MHYRSPAPPRAQGFFSSQMRQYSAKPPSLDGGFVLYSPRLPFPTLDRTALLSSRRIMDRFTSRIIYFHEIILILFL